MQHTQAFFRSFALGTVIFMVYLALELIRIFVPPEKIRLFVEDVLFVLLACFLNFLFALSQTDGSIRLFSLLAQTAAFALLYATVGRLCRLLAHKTRTALCSVWNRIYQPVHKRCQKSVLTFQNKWLVFVKSIKIGKIEKK